MKKLLFSLTLLISTTALFAQKPDAIAKFRNETIDLGKVKIDVPPTATFYVKNVGNQPLIIERVDATCGCTVPDYTKAPIAPGKEGWIKATYNAKAIGDFTKTMTVKLAGVDETKSITIKGQVLSADDFAKLSNGQNTVVKTKVDGNKTKTTTITNGKKVSKTKTKTSAQGKVPKVSRVS